MTELRPWSEEGATPAEQALLELSRREHAPAGARARALEALGLVAAASTVAAMTSAAATTGRGTAVILKLVSIPLVGAGLVAGGWAIERASRTRAVAAIEAPSITSVGSTAGAPSSAPALTTTAEATASAAAANSAPPVPSARVMRTEGAAGKLSREVQALELVQNALAAHNGGFALKLLDRYGAEFPTGALGSEATVLRVQALLMNGNRASAQALADSYSSAHPDSPYAHRIQDILQSGR